ncbi:MAG: restriction endonuclease subunit S [Geminicoccaceae bacterium]
MTEWVSFTIAELTENLDAKRVPVKEADRRPGPYPYYGASGIVDYIDSYIFEGLHLLIAEDGENLRTRKLPIAFLADGRFWVNNHAHIVRGNHKADTRFLLYALMTADVTSYLSGSTMPKLTQGNLNRIPILAPDKKQQEAIASILGSLDDKIELSRRMNETLEAMARAIFKDWFVDFGPTRSKMEGRAPYLAPDLWSLFPDRLDDEGKPRGWTNSTIGQEVDVLGGSTPSTKEPQFWGGDVAWATPKDLSSLTTPVLLSTDRQITEAGLSRIGSGLLPVGTVLLSSRAPIGYIAIAQIPVAVNQGFIAMICRKRLSNVFVWLWTQANIETVHQNANGSTFQEISKANFRPIAIAVPTPDILRAFDETAKPLFDRIASNDKENRSLAATRDFLLPKLMSGEVRVGDASQIA